MSKIDSKLTSQQFAEIKALQAMPENAIDYSDIPATISSTGTQGQF